MTVKARAHAELKAGLVHHRQGRLTEAQVLYRRTLAAEPGNADAHHLMGLLALGRHDILTASTHFERVVSLRPGVAEYRSNLGHTLRLLGELGRAEAELRRVTVTEPSFADGWINLGLVLLDLDRVDEAVVALETAVDRAPRSALSHLNLGSALLRAGRPAAAIAPCEAAIGLAPDLAAAHRNLGVAAHQAGQLDLAKRGYGRALELGPHDPDVLTNLGVILLQDDDIAGAVAAHDRAVAVAPDLAAAWLNRGTALQAAGRLDEARASFGRAVALEPGAAAHTALGSVAAERGDFLQAALDHERALRCDPDFADGHWNLSLALLGSGELARGWDEYEWRWRVPGRPADFRAYPLPVWTGESLDGARILVWREQGLGDELLFLSCLPELVSRGAIVTAMVSPRLVSLVARAFPGVRVRPDDGGVPADAEAEWHLPLGSLPGRLRRSRSAFAGSGAYLSPDDARLATWRTRLDGLPAGKRVGICWRSGLSTAERRRHYPSFADWGPVWQVPGVVWVNLQYDECEAELAGLEASCGVPVHRWPGDDLRNDLESVVALIAGLDAVVSAPTAVCAMAGAVGTRTWQVDSGNDWSAFGEDRSAWFPSIAIARKGAGDASFGPVVERLAAELTHWAGGEAR